MFLKLFEGFEENLTKQNILWFYIMQDIARSHVHCIEQIITTY